ncbi:ATP-binding cassette domain-containing protein, partial [Escherichia coli]|uniref:ATP-binding cassette domain-containing protein n=3 Tax=Pseudomonadota TaxID=1224 RepID=UPI001917BBC3
MTSILQIEGLHAHYGKSHVLQGVGLHVDDGELVTLLGRNGAGKTTTLKSICGVV